MRNNKKIFFFIFAFLATIEIFHMTHSARAEDTCDNHIIISQIYGGGGNSGSVYKNDFIELYNPTNQNIYLENWSVQYVSATKNFPASSSTSSIGLTLLHNEIKAKAYYLIQEKNNSDEGQPLENPDAIGSINLAADKGKIALVNSTSLINSENSSSVVDFVNYSGGSNTKSVYRKTNPCSNTFYIDTPNPRNSSFVENNAEELSNEDNIPQNETENINQNPPKTCTPSSSDVKLNEIFPYPASGNEFVEIKNIGNDCVDVSGWKVMDEAGHKKTFPENSIIDPGKYLFLEGNLYLNNDSDTVYLLNANGTAKSEALDQVYYEKTQENYSYALFNSEFLWTSTPTPGEENAITTQKSEEKDLPKTETSAGPTEKISSVKNIYLNEIFPNPKDDSEDEYIEIANGETEAVDLFGWTIRDGSKNGKYVFKNHVMVEAGEYLALYKTETKIALNNSNESVFLYDPRGQLISSLSYEKSQKNSSYNFDGQNWRWSKFLTPGAKNKFDSAPKVKIKKPANVYQNIAAKFFAAASDKETKKLKYAWDFGDGKKSYLKKTTHKYSKTGKYTVRLAVSDESQTIEKSFVLTVKNPPRPDLQIVKIVPNPAGIDSEGETLDVKNKSNKKVDLAGWKIATGSKEKMYNHPISGPFVLNAGETKTVTRGDSKFLLNNKAGKVALVSPEGKVVDKIEYAKEKIAEDEAYAKINGQWEWISATPKENIEASSGESEFIDDPTGEKNEAEEKEEGAEAEGEVLGASDEKLPDIYTPAQAAFSFEDAFIFLTNIGFLKSPETERDYCPLKNTTVSLRYFLLSLL